MVNVTNGEEKYKIKSYAKCHLLSLLVHMTQICIKRKCGREKSLNPQEKIKNEKKFTKEFCISKKIYMCIKNKNCLNSTFKTSD